MPRVIGVDIPDNKRLEISLTYIYGVGRSLSNEIIEYYYSWNKYIVGFLFFIVCSACIILPFIVLYVPALYFTAHGCPGRIGDGANIVVFYDLVGDGVKNHVIVTCLTILWSCFLFVYNISSLLGQIANGGMAR